MTGPITDPMTDLMTGPMTDRVGEQQVSATAEQAEFFAGNVGRLVANLGRAVIGKDDVLRLVVTCLLTQGHLLLEDVPGTGKTSLARALARTVTGQQQRIQFTPDLLPADVTGSAVLDPRTGTFSFAPGPVFATIVLADEINRASPRTQSALLEVMEEGFVTADGERHAVPRPFMVIATQNPVELAGTYPLPEAQLDRFLIRTAIGYPEKADLVRILAAAGDGDPVERVDPVVDGETVADMARLAARAHVATGILEYVGDLAEATRRHPRVRLGISVRGALALVRTAKTWAMASGRPYVTVDDVKALARPVLGHRIVLRPDYEYDESESGVESVMDEVISQVPPPTERSGAAPPGSGRVGT